MGGFDEGFHVCDGAVWWVDSFVVGDIVAHVVLRGIVHWGDPDDVDTEIFDVVDFGDYARDIAQTIAVRVLVRGGVDLIDGTIFPPGSGSDRHDCGWRVGG